MKTAIFMTTCFFASLLFAQGDALPQSYQYRVPLPGTKTVSNSDWMFSIEAVALVDEEYQIDVQQYDIRGRLADTVQTFLQPSKSVFTWSSQQTQSRRLRSIILISNRPLSGTIWMFNDVLGQINGFALSEQQAPRLVVSHIPEAFFEMTTSFSVLGTSPTEARSDINFLFYDQNSLSHSPSVVRSNWPSFGYLISTPEVTLSIGDLDENVSASWGLVFGGQPDYQLSGFQTFTREDASKLLSFTQTAGVELQSEGDTSGYYLFSNLADQAFQEEFVFTNPGSQAVVLNLRALTRNVDEEGAVSVQLSEANLTLAPFQKRIFTLGQDDFFADLVGQPVWLSYQSFSTAEVPEPLPVIALHFQNDVNEQSMGAHHATQAGTEIITWINRADTFETALEIASIGLEKLVLPEGIDDPELIEEEDRVYQREETLIKVSIFNDELRIPATFHPIFAGDTFSNYNSQVLRDLTSELLKDEGTSPLMVKVEVVSGPPIFAKQTAFRENDIAIVNPLIRTPVIEVVEGEEGEETQSN